ncbi:MAG: MAPEG family protein [Alphaproteobacteria bacterium]
MTVLNILVALVFVQVALTFWSIARMGIVRVASLKARRVALKDVALSSEAYPVDVHAHQNNVENQFETPVLFYAAVGVAAAMGAANWGMVVGALIFIVSRLVHYRIHVGENNLHQRFNAFLAGLVGLVICWGALGLRLLDIA